MMRFAEEYAVIVIGGGHAGTEAALAAARMGRPTLLLTHNIETLGQMSCNPAIGGIGKGHLVKEIDALGGAMAAATDQAGIQFRTLNASKGPAVRATRAQADRQLYKRAIRRALETQTNLTLFQQEASDLLLEGDRASSAVLSPAERHGSDFGARAVVLTLGTFLGGWIHVGLLNHAGGRASAIRRRCGGYVAAVRDQLHAGTCGSASPEDRHAAANRRSQHRFFRDARTTQR